MANPDLSVTLSNLYGDLQRFGDAQNYEKALKTADAILKAAPGESEAFQAKIVCLIQIGDFQNALQCITKEKDISRTLVFEKAYCQYRLNANEEALATLKSSSQLDLRCKELKAQLLYRLEEYEECLQLYKEVLKNSQDDYDEERHTNFSAVVASLSVTDQDTVTAPPDPSEGRYEHYYNNACYFIGKGDYKAAQYQLLEAEKFCLSSLEEEEMTDEERDDELAIIRVQLAYCAQMLGNNAEATKLYNAVLKNKPSDISVTAVAANNTVTINQDQNVFDSKKKMKLATSADVLKKLTTKQQETIDVNQCLLAFHANQVDQCRVQCSSIREKYPNNDIPTVVESCLLLKSQQPTKAIDLLQSCVDKSKDKSVTYQLLLAQLYLSNGEIPKAIGLLRSMDTYSFKPAMVSLLVSLYLASGDNKAASQYFNDVISWYEKNQPDAPSFVDILKAAASFQMKTKNAKLAAQLLEKLRKHRSGDRGILSMLFAAYSQYDANKAKELSNELPSIENLAASIDAFALEESSAQMGSKNKPKKDDTQGNATNTEELIAKKKKTRKRKGKLPKNYNPEVGPDPERWLPKRERSTWKGRRKDKKKDTIGKGSQGTTSAGGPELDITKMESVPEQPAVVIKDTGSKGYSASKQQQKKKKRVTSKK